MEACKAGGAGLLARILYDFGNRNGDEGGQALHRRSGLRQILTGKGLFNMFTRKQTCGVCGYRVTPTKEVQQNGFGQATGYNIEGITENKPVYLDFEQVAAVVRVYSDEKEAGGGE